MSRKQWAVVIAVIGLGIVFPIFQKHEMTGDGMAGSAAAATSKGDLSPAAAPKGTVQGTLRTVEFDVTGMT